MRLRRLVAATTFCGLAGAIAVSLLWLLVTDERSALEPAAQLLGLVAALTGILAERLATERQRRRLALAALVEELAKNRAVLGDLLCALGRGGSRPAQGVARRRVYPRLLLSATDGIIASGVLADGDQEALARLHRWRNEVADFNRRLDLTEMLTFLQGSPEAFGRFERALSRDDGRGYRIGRLLQELIDYLERSFAADLPRPAPHEPAGPAPEPAAVPTPQPAPVVTPVVPPVVAPAPRTPLDDHAAPQLPLRAAR